MKILVLVAAVLLAGCVAVYNEEGARTTICDTGEGGIKCPQVP